MLFCSNPRREQLVTRVLTRKGIRPKNSDHAESLLSEQFKHAPKFFSRYFMVLDTSNKEQAEALAVQAAFLGDAPSLNMLKSAIRYKPEFRETFMEGLYDIIETSPNVTIRYRALDLLLGYASCADAKLAADARYEIARLNKINDSGYGAVKGLLDSIKFDLNHEMNMCAGIQKYSVLHRFAAISYIVDLFLGSNGSIGYASYLGVGICTATVMAAFYHAIVTIESTKKKLHLLE